MQSRRWIAFTNYMFRLILQDTLIEFLQSSSAVVCQYFARLLNTMASMSAGKSIKMSWKSLEIYCTVIDGSCHRDAWAWIPSWIASVFAFPRESWHHFFSQVSHFFYSRQELFVSKRKVRRSVTKDPYNRAKRFYHEWEYPWLFTKAQFEVGWNSCIWNNPVLDELTT